MTHDPTFKPNTQGLLAHAQQKSQETHQRVQRMIDQLLRRHQTINFNSVAQAAKVTKSYLYAHPDLRERIEVLRSQQAQAQKQSQQIPSQPVSRTDKSKEVLIAAKERRIKELEEQNRKLEQENRKLKEELKQAYGKLYERV
jgi:predicted transcriptional regulator